MTKRNFAGISILVLLIAAGCTREGPMGIPGTAGLGTVEGVITVWQDLSWNSKNSSVDPAGVTVMLEGTEYSATTDDFGAYKIEAIPAGGYVIMAFKDSASAEGYGTVKQYNFWIGGGETVYFSTDIARKTEPPTEIEVGTLTLEGEPGVIVSWMPADPNLSHRYTVWYASDPGFERKSPVATREGTLAFIPSYMLPEGTLYFAVSADNGISYVDKSAGETIAPTTSALSGPPWGSGFRPECLLRTISARWPAPSLRGMMRTPVVTISPG